MNVLVTGGAGYIGSHCCVQLIATGHRPVILDNLTNAKPGVLDHLERVAGTRPHFMRGDVRDGDLVALGRLMAASHASMRDDFEITVPVVDRLAELLQRAIGEQGGARMTGGGFGDCVVAPMPQLRVAEARAAVQAGYRARGGEAATVWVCRASAGAGLG